MPAQADQTAGVKTRARILAKALPLFAEHGYAGTSVRMVGKAASVNVATLAYHFTDKDGLYRACIERLYEDLAALEAEPLLAGPDPLDALVRHAWSFSRDHRVHVRLLHRHLLDRGRHHDVLMEIWLEPLLARVRPLLVALRPDWSETERRLLLFSAMHLIVRFVLDDPAELAAGLGVEDLDGVVVPWLTSLIRARLTMT